jgi:hypothetical protein
MLVVGSLEQIKALWLPWAWEDTIWELTVGIVFSRHFL